MIDRSSPFSRRRAGLALALLGAAWAHTAAAQISSGHFRVVNQPAPDFQGWAAETRAILPGDFNGDGRTDIAAVGKDGWQSLPVALSNGDGSFRVVNHAIQHFQSWAAQTNAILAADFDGDGKTDIAAVGKDGWQSLPVALSNGDGSFRVVNQAIQHFQSWAAETRAILTGDFNGDRRADIVAVGKGGWQSLPVALSNGDGSFRVVNQSIPHFQSWAAETRVILTGDFNGDGKTDLAAVGKSGWQALPVALSNGDGSFRVVNQPIPHFQSWAAETKAILAGDFNGDGKTDLAAAGRDGWQALPVALSNGDGSFRAVNQAAPEFQSWAAQTNAIVPGDYEGNGRMALAAVGRAGWGNIPVAFANGDGSFSITNRPVPEIQPWMAETRAVVPGDFNGDGKGDFAGVGKTGWNSIPVALADAYWQVQRLDNHTGQIVSFSLPLRAGRSVTAGQAMQRGDLALVVPGQGGILFLEGPNVYCAGPPFKQVTVKYNDQLWGAYFYSGIGGVTASLAADGALTLTPTTPDGQVTRGDTPPTCGPGGVIR